MQPVQFACEGTEHLVGVAFPAATVLPRRS